MKVYKKVLRDLKKYLIGTNEFLLIDNMKSDFYPIDLSFTLKDVNFYYSPVDEKGIPYKIYCSVGEQYNPTRVAAYALAHYNEFLKKDSFECRMIFLKCADWFLSYEKARYEYQFDWEDLKAPWISCMAQGEAASVLVRAYKMTNDVSYLHHAEKSLEPFFCLSGEGGVQSRLPDGSLFLEEYPSSNPTHVLNGYMYALIGLSEYLDVSGSDRHSLLFLQLFESLKKNITLWSSGNWSLYEDPAIAGGKNYCTPSYHNLQISQLKWLCDRIDAPELKTVVNSWVQGLNSLPTRLRALFGKIYFRLINRAQR